MTTAAVVVDDVTAYYRARLADKDAEIARLRRNIRAMEAHAVEQAAKYNGAAAAGATHMADYFRGKADTYESMAAWARLAYVKEDE